MTCIPVYFDVSRHHGDRYKRLCYRRLSFGGNYQGRPDATIYYLCISITAQLSEQDDALGQGPRSGEQETTVLYVRMYVDIDGNVYRSQHIVWRRGAVVYVLP